MLPPEFLDQVLLAARTCQRTTGIPASFTIAQAALESSWGGRAPGNNHFGLQADKSWQGATVDISTHEVVKGVRVAMVDKFRAYPSWADCLLDHAQFFLQNPRYRKCFLERTGEGWARAAATAGYATDPAYADKLIAIMRGRNLARFDDLSARVPA
jgi:flagellum-specific peptidoglycan hydrolase FlgJ